VQKTSKRKAKRQGKRPAKAQGTVPAARLTAPPSEMKHTFLDLDLPARRFRFGTGWGVAIVIAVLALTGNLHWTVPLAIPTAISKCLDRYR